MALPEKDKLLAWIRDNPGHSAKRDIARAFNLKGGERIELKRLLRELEDEGEVERRRKRFSKPGELPPVAVLVVGEADADGDLFAAPQEWRGEGEAPRILLTPGGRGPAPGTGDLALTRLTPVGGEAHAYEGRIIKIIGRAGASGGAQRMLGVFRGDRRAGGGRVVPTSKGESKEWRVAEGDEGGARDGDLVQAEALGRGPRRGREFELPRARVVEVLGDAQAPKSYSLIAIHEQGIPDVFPDAVLEAAERAAPASAEGREDLTALPLVTIDPQDARDHDDAVCAIPDDDPANEGGFVLWVAIADVAHYVRPGAPLDVEARARGNSTYFPDRVVPMLPERLSADLCSLVEGEDRPCLACRIVIDAEGEKRAHSFHRGLMRSPASLTYEQAQAIADAAESGAAGEVEEAVIDLFDAYDLLAEAQTRRGPLALDLPEREIRLGEDGQVLAVGFRERLDAHKLIESFMVLANVCAAETLEAKRRGLLFRVHEEPGADKLDALRETAESCGFAFARGEVARPSQFNRLLDQAAGGDFAELINLSVLRAQTQAYYAPDNHGHFGLNLRRYAHFTSPIRRYADLIVHRALIGSLGLGDGAAGAALRGAEAREGLRETAEHISRTERRSMEAE
ncbi:MAG: RNB domain-containing ribonuclease, partial [Pseudomonadota bacterium]